jgi:hypothetical protein
LENVEENLVEYLLLLYESQAKSGGGAIDKHVYNPTSKLLAIYYQDRKTAKRVINFGSVTFRQKVYKAKYHIAEMTKAMNKLCLSKEKGIHFTFS